MTYTAKFFNWLSVRPTWSELWSIIWRLYALKVSWSICVIIVLASLTYLFGLSRPAQKFTDAELFRDLTRTGILLLVGIVVVIEEVLARLVPLSTAMILVKFGMNREKTLAIGIVVASLVFGLGHLTNYSEIAATNIAASLAFQAVGGIISSIIFLKYCGTQLRYVFGAFVTVTLFHFLWNLPTLLPVLLWR